MSDTFKHDVDKKKMQLAELVLKYDIGSGQMKTGWKPVDAEISALVSDIKLDLIQLEMQALREDS